MIVMPINTLIVDDEKPARDELVFLLKGFPEINIVGQGKNGEEALNLIKEHAPDLVFLDVQMPGLNGFGVIKKLMDRKIRVPQIIFATAYDQLRRARIRSERGRLRSQAIRQSAHRQSHPARQKSRGGKQSARRSARAAGESTRPGELATREALGEIAADDYCLWMPKT